ncbi:hypothetical protein ELUMI_v1c05390 [Williamsoniiplasma luminosum]|uniref:Uncharacterized protein n=1 Tax=Williamsoniiplasma luminosum TaxID=214888 RepID=A0A2K8NXA2_9MOLU|nr:hypothetical protein [Williamsoniiplasma luminosum]ATZ17263.1 hypothetical protein ELUMI_v1c05390 [Williamsoniiplasma luminosum]
MSNINITITLKGMSAIHFCIDNYWNAKKALWYMKNPRSGMTGIPEWICGICHEMEINDSAGEEHLLKHIQDYLIILEDYHPNILKRLMDDEEQYIRSWKFYYDCETHYYKLNYLDPINWEVKPKEPKETK